MDISFLAKFGCSDIYQLKKRSGEYIKLSINSYRDCNNDIVWKADIFVPQTGEWKCFVCEKERDCKSFDDFLNKLDLVLTD